MKNITLHSYVDRDEFILERSRGKRVLHLGCVGFTDCSVAEKISLARQSLHYRLSQVSDCVGIDLDAPTVWELRATGVFDNVVVGDVEQLEEFANRWPPFDLVVAGDIIEHLSNPGRMLRGVHPFLKPGGCLVISTPNAFGLIAQLRHAAGRFREGAQHVLCFNAISLAQLLDRNGFRVIEAHSCHQKHARNAPKLFFGSAVFASEFSPNLVELCFLWRRRAMQTKPSRGLSMVARNLRPPHEPP